MADYLTFRSQVLRVIAKIVGRDDAEDISQEAFVRCFEAAKKHPIDNPRAFLIKTAVNLALNHIGRTERRLSDSFDDAALIDSPSAAPTPEASYDSAVEFLKFCQAVSALPPQCRRAFVLRKIFGVSQKEIALTLGVSEGTVEKHVAKGLAACGRAMGSRAA